MKRLAPLLLVLVLLPCLIVPASATTQEVVDALTNSSGQSWLMGVYNVLVDIRTDIEDDITVILEDIQARIRSIQGKLSGTLPDGAYSIGEISALIFTKLQEAVDSLGWIDSQIRDVETAVLNGFTDTTGKLTSILEQMYTNGTLTIGEYVKGIRSYLVTIAGYLDTGVEYTIGQFMSRFDDAFIVIEDKLYEISGFLQYLLGVNRTEADATIDDAQQTTDDLEDMENLLATSPTIDDSGVDSAISGVNGKFQNITTDADGTLLFGALGEIAKGNIFSQLIPTSAMLGVLSFALFGRVF